MCPLKRDVAISFATYSLPVSRELNRKRRSQPDPDPISFMAAWPDQPAGAYIGRM
jgi:hypothetical protein